MKHEKNLEQCPYLDWLAGQPVQILDEKSKSHLHSLNLEFGTTLLRRKRYIIKKVENELSKAAPTGTIGTQQHHNIHHSIKNGIALWKLHAHHYRIPTDTVLHLLLPSLPIPRHRRRPPRHVVPPRGRGRRGIPRIRPLPRGSIDVRPLPPGAGVRRATPGGDTDETRRQSSVRDNSAGVQDEGLRFIHNAGQGVVDGHEKVNR